MTTATELEQAMGEAATHLSTAVQDVLNARVALLRVGLGVNHQLPKGLDRLAVIVGDFEKWYRENQHQPVELARLEAELRPSEDPDHPRDHKELLIHPDGSTQVIFGEW